MDRLTVAFVGCGHIALEYVAVYCGLPWVRLVLCIDVDETQGHRLADRCESLCGFRPVVTSDFETALEPGIDLVVINTPNDMHCPQAVAAMSAGKHVLLQKPLAATLEDSERIVLAAATARGRVGMYMSYLDQPVLHDMRNLVQQGFYGDVVEFYGRCMHPKGIVWSKEAQLGNTTWRNSVKRTGGGCFIQLAVHYIRLVQWILNTRITEVQAFTSNLHSPGLEGGDQAMAWMRTEAGARVLLSTAWCAHGEQLSITGTQGESDYLHNAELTLKPPPGFEFHGRVIDLSPGAEERVHLHLVAPRFGEVENQLNQHRRFLEALRDGTPVDVSLKDALEDMRVLTACYESAVSGRITKVDSITQLVART